MIFHTNFQLRSVILGGIFAIYCLCTLTPVSANESGTINLMRKSMLGHFEDEDWEGYACSFLDWATCVNSTKKCGNPHPSCGKCVSTRGSKNNHSIGCTQEHDNNHLSFHFPAGGIFPVVEQFTVPPNTAIIGAANPNHLNDKSKQQTDISGQTWFVIPLANALCAHDPSCSNVAACSGNPRTHRQGFLVSSNTTLKNFNFQGGMCSAFCKIIKSYNKSCQRNLCMFLGFVSHLLLLYFYNDS